jgi:plastocyanin
MRGLAVAAAVVVLAAVALPALAADSTTITAQNTLFDPKTVTIDPGETVTFDNVGGMHNFDFGPGQAYPAVPTDSTDPVWNTPLKRTFDTPGTYNFHCDQHGIMTGKVIVRDPSATPVPTPSPTPTPSSTPDPGNGPPPGTQPTLAIRSLRVRAAKFCTSRSRACRHPGIAVRIDLTVASHVRGTLKRGRRKAGKVDLGTVAAGPRTVRFGRRLKPGNYTLLLRAGTLPPRTLRFKVRA